MSYGGKFKLGAKIEGFKYSANLFFIRGIILVYLSHALYLCYFGSFMYLDIKL